MVDSFHVGDVGVKIYIGIKNERGQTVPLDDVDVKLFVKKPSGIETEWVDIEKVFESDEPDAIATKVVYSTRLGDLDEDGLYTCYPKLSYNDGSGKIISGDSFNFKVVDVFTDS